MVSKKQERLNELKVLEWAMKEAARDPRHARVALEVYAEGACERLKEECEAEKKAEKAKVWGHIKHLALFVVHIAVVAFH